MQAVEAIARHLRSGQLIILSRRSIPSTTDEVVFPILETSVSRGKDFYLAFSPGAGDFWQCQLRPETFRKWLAHGFGERRPAVALHARCRAGRLAADRVAEMVKPLENTRRAVNIGLINDGHDVPPARHRRLRRRVGAYECSATVLYLGPASWWHAFGRSGYLLVGRAERSMPDSSSGWSREPVDAKEVVERVAGP